MKQFKYSLAIEGAEAELKSLIPQLEKLGYTKHECYEKYSSSFDTTYLATNFNGCPGHLTNIYPNLITDYNRTVVPASNTELVLALAACVEGDEFHVGEWVYSLNESIDYKNGGLYRIDELRTGINPISLVISKAAGGNTKSVQFFRKATKEEILNHFNMKKIIGYKLKEDCKEYAVAACKIEGYISMGESIKNCHPIPLDEAYRTDRRAGFDKLKKAGVLDLWFEPVYEEQKRVIYLRYNESTRSGGEFEIEVSKDGIYYAPEDAFLNIADLRKAVEATEVCYKKGNSSSSYYSFKPTHLDSGCKKGVPVEDWIKVLNAYDEIKSK